MTGKIRVLLVEDEQTQTMIIKDTLDGQGLDVSLSYDGNEDLSRFYTECPNVQVVDVMMPRMDGFEMVPRIRMMYGETDARSNMNITQKTICTTMYRILRHKVTKCGNIISRSGGSWGEKSIAIAPFSPIHEGRPLQWSKYRNGDNMCYEIKPQETPV